MNNFFSSISFDNLDADLIYFVQRITTIFLRVKNSGLIHLSVRRQSDIISENLPNYILSFYSFLMRGNNVAEFWFSHKDLRPQKHSKKPKLCYRVLFKKTNICVHKYVPFILEQLLVGNFIYNYLLNCNKM